MHTTTKNSLKISVDGKVQRVGYRHYIKKSADALGVLGQVQNQADGQVEIIAVASAAVLDEFMLHVKRGSVASQVTKLDWSVCQTLDFTDFQIA